MSLDIHNKENLVKPLEIVVIEGSKRVQRDSIHAARLVEEIGRGLEGVNITFVDPNDFDLPGDGNDPEGKDPKYTAITAMADAFFIVTPEYNHSFPGSLKRLLDSELANYVHKPVAFCGCSSQRWGGVRAIEALNQTVREMGLVSTFTDVNMPKIAEVFDEDGKLLQPVYRELIQRAYAELIWMAKTLQWGRQNLPRA
jgi:NAD(P)H-dependent FMN reductase